MTQTMTVGAFCWFDIAFENQERAQKFYGELFGWQFNEMEGAEAGYIGIDGSNNPEPVAGCTALGAMLKKQHPGHGITIYFSVPSVDEWSAKVKELGGQVVSEKVVIEGHGAFAVCVDTEGNTFAIWACDSQATHSQ